VLLREGREHAVYVNRAKNKTSTVPRHCEINDFLAAQDLPRPRDSGAALPCPGVTLKIPLVPQPLGWRPMDVPGHPQSGNSARPCREPPLGDSYSSTVSQAAGSRHSRTITYPTLEAL
jgi:hypothetical protein